MPDTPPSRKKPEQEPVSDQRLKDAIVGSGIVPATCTMQPMLLMGIIQAEAMDNRGPCDRCNEDRSVCHGNPRKGGQR